MRKILSVFMLCLAIILNVLLNTPESCAQESGLKISIIIPVYNSELYLREWLDSVVNQTLKELQILCINDGSTDGSLEILREYEKNDPRVIVIGQENQGVSAARNTGLEVALQSDAEYITFVDSDDYLNLDTYEIAYKDATEYDIDILNFGWKSFPQETHWDKYKSSPKEKFFENDSIEAWLYCGVGANVNLWNKLYRRKFLQAVETRFREDLICASDYCFNALVFPQAKRVRFIPTKLYNYRRETLGNITSTTNRVDRMKNHIKIIKNIIQNWQNNDFIHGYEDRILRHFLSWNMGNLSSIEDENERSICAKKFLETLAPLYDTTLTDKTALSYINKVKSLIVEKFEEECVGL